MNNPFRDLPKCSGDFRSNPIMRRYAGNPILTKAERATIPFRIEDWRK